jgi:hypothetical protein
VIGQIVIVICTPFLIMKVAINNAKIKNYVREQHFFSKAQCWKCCLYLGTYRIYIKSSVRISFSTLEIIHHPSLLLLYIAREGRI